MVSARRVLAGLGAALTLALAAPAVADDDRAERWVEAAELEAAGEYAAAFDVLDDLAAAYPQDYALHLRLGWLAFQAERYAAAGRYYDRAATLSGGSFDARLGLAWTALRRGRAGEARERFAALADERPDDAGAVEGLAAAQEAREGWIGASVRALAYGYPGHPLDEWGLGFAVGAEGGYRRLVAGVAYRYGRFSYELPTGQPAAAAAPTANGPGYGPGPGPDGTGGAVDGAAGAAREQVDEHELFVHAGAAWERFGVTGHYAYLATGSDIIGDGHVGGAVARISPLGDVLAEASLAGFDDAALFRAALSWRIPVAGPLSLRPHGALQVMRPSADGTATAYGSGGLALGLEDDRGALWIGGRGGREVRPVYLTVPVSYVLGETILAGATLDGRVRFAPGWSLVGGVELYRASYSVAIGQGTGTGHFGLAGSLGVAFEH